MVFESLTKGNYAEVLFLSAYQDHSGTAFVTAWDKVAWRMVECGLCLWTSCLAPCLALECVFCGAAKVPKMRFLESKTGLSNCSSEANFSWTAVLHARLATKFVSQDNNIETALALSARTVSDLLPRSISYFSGSSWA